MKTNHYKILESINDFIHKSKILTLLLLTALFTITACKKLVETTPPPTSILGSAAYSSDATAIQVLNGLYSQVASGGTSGRGSLSSLSFFGGLSADEFSLISSVTDVGQLAYYQNNLSSSGSAEVGSEYWIQFYPNIYTCNAAIEGLNASTTLTPAVKQQLLGEAQFMRAFFYFYLVNLYGGVPLALSTDYAINGTLARSTTAQVWAQIKSDLVSAEGLLVDGYVQSNGVQLYPAASAERVRPNKYAAAALLARAYLYTNDPVNAEKQASIVINKTTYYNLTPLNSAFLKNSQEAIWQLQPVNSNFNTPDGQFFNYPTAGGPTPGNPVYLSSALLSSFEVGDQRMVSGNWVKSITVGTTIFYYPYKYKVYLANAAVTGSPSTLTEYEMVLRLGEQYLIRAESRAQQQNTSGALSDLNAIRARAGLPNSIANQSTLLTAIQHEREVELFSELGQRWLDLKRTGNVDAVMGAGGACVAKGGIWNTYQQLYPLHYSDIIKDVNLRQNPGY